MRLTTFLSGASAALAISMAAMMLAATPATAGGRLKERVYDDSFGNLIIISPAGYKRIVVGKGYIAGEMAAERGPDVVYLPQGDHAVPASHCYQPPVLWKGRGYMYGLADGEIPTPPIVCD